jgi:hypothetical protein
MAASQSKILEIQDEASDKFQTLFRRHNTAVMNRNLMEAQEALEEIMEAKEGFYEKLWKDFVSLQRGDVSKIAVEAEEARRLREELAKKSTTLQEMSIPELSILKSHVEVILGRKTHFLETNRGSPPL